MGNEGYLMPERGLPYKFVWFTSDKPGDRRPTRSARHSGIRPVV
jgi:hypothetical protein